MPNVKCTKPPNFPPGGSTDRQRELQEIIDRSPAVAFLWKAAPGWPVEYVTGNVGRFGYTTEEFTSGGLLFVDIVHPDDRARVAEEVARYSAEGRAEFRQEYRILTRAGDTRWVEDHTWVRRDGRGVVTHYQGILSDITPDYSPAS